MNQKTIDKFKEFLKARGAEVLEPTNPYEVIRFRAGDSVSVVYTGRRGITMTGDSEAAYEAFTKAGKWDAGIKTKSHITRRSVKVRTLVARDGSLCFYCHKQMEEGKETVEHLLAVAHGGPHHLSNLVLSHSQCNMNGGHLPIMAKIKIRESHGS